MQTNRKREKVECPNCGRQFGTKSRSSIIICSRCNRKFRRKKNIVKKK